MVYGVASRFLKLTLDGGEWSASRSGRLTPGEISPHALRYAKLLGIISSDLDATYKIFCIHQILEKNKNIMD
jgi:hypothetical protein